MPVRLADLLDAPGLHLVALTGSTEALRAPVRWCAVTELTDPRPWLQGGELVLTTGLRQRSAAAQREFVQKVAERTVAAIGFGTGLTHERVPRATIVAAEALGLPVLEVPYETPFLAVDRFVADQVLAEQYGRQHELLRMHDGLARALLSGGGLDSLVHALRQMIGAPVAVVDSSGGLLAGEATAVDHSVPVEVAGAIVAQVRTGAPHQVLPYAAILVGLELARRQAVLAGRRELVGQVIEDIVRATLSEGEAARRLATFGIDASRPHTVLLATAGRDADPGGDRLRGLPGGVYPLSASGAEPVVSAHLGEHLVVVVGEDRPGVGTAPATVAAVARQTLSYVAQLGEEARVGIGGAYPGVAGLRWSFYEAREALTRGPGVNAREPLSLPGLLLASDALPLAELGRAVLAPLLDFDEQGGGGGLVDTLRAYLEEDASVARVAARLFVHRNTVRYRLDQIERLTGRSLASTQDRVQFWLALHAVALGSS